MRSVFVFIVTMEQNDGELIFCENEIL